MSDDRDQRRCARALQDFPPDEEHGVDDDTEQPERHAWRRDYPVNNVPFSVHLMCCPTNLTGAMFIHPVRFSPLFNVTVISILPFRSGADMLLTLDNGM